MARNADDATFSALIDDAAQEEPLAIAVSLLQVLMLMAEKTQRPDLEAKAREKAIRLLGEAEWAARAVWVDNKFQMRRLLGWAASVSTEDGVRERIAAVVAGQPELLESILVGISQQAEQRDRDDWSRLLRIDVHIEDLPGWFPTSVIAAEIRRQYPDLQAATRHASQENEDEIQALAAHVLDIDSRPA